MKLRTQVATLVSVGVFASSILLAPVASAVDLTVNDGQCFFTFSAQESRDNLLAEIDAMEKDLKDNYPSVSAYISGIAAAGREYANDPSPENEAKVHDAALAESFGDWEERSSVYSLFPSFIIRIQPAPDSNPGLNQELARDIVSGKIDLFHPIFEEKYKHRAALERADHFYLYQACAQGKNGTITPSPGTITPSPGGNAGSGSSFGSS